MDDHTADRPDHDQLPAPERGHDCWAQVIADLERAVGPIRRDGRRFHLPPADVDDAVQDALCQAWLKRKEHDGARPLIYWLRGFGRRAILARLMARSISGGSDGIECASVASEREPLPGEYAEVQESRDRMRELVAQAPSRYREVLLARYWEGQRISDVADRLGHTPKTIRRRLDRALEWLEVGWREVGAPSGAGDAPRKISESAGKNGRPFG